MREVELQTRDGHFVATVEIAPFPDRGMPEVVSWGDRVFVQADEQPLDPATRPWVYTEACAVVSFTPSPGHPKREPALPPDPPPVDRSARCTVGEAVAPGVPNTEDRGDGQQKGYVVLCDAERAKGYVRPVRDSYVHVGVPTPPYPLRDPSAEEREIMPEAAKVMDYPEGSPDRERGAIKKYFTARQLKGCGTKTTMGRQLSETYARDPGFYSGTFCCGCRTHLPVGANGEFVWDGTDQRVGT